RTRGPHTFKPKFARCCRFPQSPLDWGSRKPSKRDPGFSDDQAPFRIAQTLENAPAQERSADAAILAQLFKPDRVMWSKNYRYDDRGRRIECSTSMWALHTDHSIWEYDEYDNAIRTIHDDTAAADLQSQ